MSRGRPKGSTKKPDTPRELTLHEKAARYDAIVQQARKRAGYVEPPKTEFERGMRAITSILTMTDKELKASIEALKAAIEKHFNKEV